MKTYSIQHIGSRLEALLLMQALHQLELEGVCFALDTSSALNDDADALVIYHGEDDWETLAEQASRLKIPVILTGTFGTPEEAERAANAGCLYFAGRSYDLRDHELHNYGSWGYKIKIAVGVAALCDEVFRSRIVDLLEKPTDLDGKLGLFVPEWCQLAHFVNTDVLFYQTLLATACWIPVFFANCDEVDWVMIRRRFGDHLTRQSVVDEDEWLQWSEKSDARVGGDVTPYDNPGVFYAHLIERKGRAYVAEMLSSGPMIQKATLDAMARSTAEFDLLSLPTCGPDQDFNVVKSLIQLIDVRRIEPLYPYVAAQVTSSNEQVRDAAVDVCRRNQIHSSADDIVANLRTNVSLHLLWAVEELKLVQARPILREIVVHQEEPLRKEAQRVLKVLESATNDPALMVKEECRSQMVEEEWQGWVFNLFHYIR